MPDHSLSANCVDHFRRLTFEDLLEMDEEQTDDLAAACVAGFTLFGDPRCWVGYDELTEVVKHTLCEAWKAWPGPADATLVIPKGALIN